MRRHVTALAAVVLCAFGCERESLPPHDVSMAAESFGKAIMHNDCKRAWSMMSESARLASDYEHYCRRMGRGCSAGSVRVEHGKPNGSGYVVAGSTQCSGQRRLSFGVEMIKEKGVWAVASFSEGDWIN